MVRYWWTLYEGSRVVDSGEVEAENVREAMGQVFLAKADDVRPSGNYQVKVDGTSMSSSGDEFRRSAEAAGWSEDQTENIAGQRYLFNEALPAVLDDGDRQREFDQLLGSCDLPQPCVDGNDHDRNDDVINPWTGEIHAQCQKCGFIDPKGTGRLARDPYSGPAVAPFTNRINYQPPKTQFTFRYDRCGRRFLVHLNGSVRRTGVLCPGCDATYSFG